jgi:signal transduction histidine kinase/ligand-binding sensor domain-containing protein/DNA-binding NarL/FixJ family response regulator
LYTVCRQAFFLYLLILQLLLAGGVCAQSPGFPEPQHITARHGLPQGFVPGIVQDSLGFIWMATRDGLCRYDGHHFRVFQPGDGRFASLSSLGLENVQSGADGKIWILTDPGHIDLFDPVRETFVNFSRQAFYQKQFGKKFLRDMYPDSQGRLWLLFDGPGVSLIDQQRRIHRYEFFGTARTRLNVRHVTEDRQGTIWAATGEGIFQIKKSTGAIAPYYKPDPEFARVSKEAYTLKELQNGKLLMLLKSGIALLDPVSGKCTYRPLALDNNAQYRHPIAIDSKGNAYFFRMNGIYRLDGQDSLAVFPFQPDVQEYKSLFIDRSDVLWAGTNGQGVRKFNLRAGYFNTSAYKTGFVKDLLTDFLHVPANEASKLPTDPFPYNFRYAFETPDQMWFAVGRTPLYRYDLSSKKLETIPFPIDIRDIKRAELAVSLSRDPDGRMWAFYDSLLVFWDKGKWERFAHPVRPGVVSAVLQIVVDKRFIWLATASQGLYRIEKATGGIRRFANIPGNVRSLNNNNLYCLFADPLDDNLLWIGTFGGGMCSFDKRTGLCRRLSKQTGLPNDVVYAAIPDRQGHVWAATNQGLCQVDRNTLKVRIYTREDGLIADEFNRFHALQLPDGRIFLGGIEGITAFDPQLTNEDRYKPSVYVTSIQINNEPLVPDVNRGETPVATLPNIELPYDRNFLSIEFAAMQYNRSDKIRYRYQLDGVDEAWVESEIPVTKYTDLRPGNYLLKLNASNTLGVWSPEVRQLAIVIHPPWWRTWWAYLLYFVAMAAILYVVIRTYVNRLRLRQSVLFKQKQVDFFSNITHEFRTPLTLILGPAEQMLDEQRSEKDSKRLTLIDRNAKQLLGLINQLLDLSKLEAGTARVDTAWGDLADFIERLVQTFQIAAQAKEVTLHFDIECKSCYYWFDHEKLERIINNLLSNAVKFADRGGKVWVELRSQEKGVEMVVGNTGAGIAEKDLEKVFERFYQSSGAGYREGTGIGLALVKELVELQGGEISVSSGVDKNTVFTLKMPYRQGDVPNGKSGSADSRHLASTNSKDVVAGHAANILLVEDNAGLAGFISDSLAEKYSFHLAANGEEAIALALEIMPDLIISDVMMPVMDGYTFCKNIKSNLETSHIPVVLLTAKSALESRVEGLELGADDYITKPFHMHELRLRIRNLLDRQRRLYDHLHAEFTAPAPLQPAETDGQSDPFLAKLYDILDSRLENPEFGVNQLVHEIGMSNSSLNRKLKTLTNLPAVELIRNYRLKKAASLLTNGIPVSEAAYIVGFDNLSYFAKCFKDLYQMPPRDFAAKGGV